MLDLNENADTNTNAHTNAQTNMQTKVRTNVKTQINMQMICDYINSIIALLVPKCLKGTCCGSLVHVGYWILFIAISLTMAYFAIIGLTLFFTYIFTVQDYNIHTGCLYNDTLVESGPYVYRPYCFDNTTSTRYNTLLCSAYDNRNIFAGCMLIGFIATACIGSIIFFVIMICGIYRDYRQRKNKDDEENINSNVKRMTIITDDKRISLDSQLYEVNIRDGFVDSRGSMKAFEKSLPFSNGQDDKMVRLDGDTSFLSQNDTSMSFEQLSE